MCFKLCVIVRFVIHLYTAEFRTYFEKYGKVVSAEVMFHRETHKSRGFGFIVFELEQNAVDVCSVKVHIIDGKEVFCIDLFLIPETAVVDIRLTLSVSFFDVSA